MYIDLLNNTKDKKMYAGRGYLVYPSGPLKRRKNVIKGKHCQKGMNH